MGRQESPQLIERKTQVNANAQATSRASKYSKLELLEKCIIYIASGFCKAVMHVSSPESFTS